MDKTKKTKATRQRAKAFSCLLGYDDIHLHTASRWYIDFKAMDPKTGVMKRKKYFISNSLSVKQKNRTASAMISFLSIKLQEGWTPWGAEDYSEGLRPFAECLDKYIQQVEMMDRKKTRQSYSSRVNMLKKFIAQREYPILMVNQFTTSFCCDFLDWIHLDCGDSARTRNNYRDWLFGFAQFLIQRNNIKENPVACIASLPEAEKQRKALTPDMLKKIREYLLPRDKHFYLACLLEYYAFIRPTELSYVKIEDIHLKRRTISLHAETSKNHKDEEVAINKEIIEIMLDLGVLSKPSSFYLFSKDCKPGMKHLGSDQFNKAWVPMRDYFGWSDCYQFYSLKNSGIRDLANAKGIIVARDQARHADVSTTNNYVSQHVVHECTKHFKGKL